MFLSVLAKFHFHYHKAPYMFVLGIPVFCCPIKSNINNERKGVLLFYKTKHSIELWIFGICAIYKGIKCNVNVCKTMCIECYTVFNFDKVKIYENFPGRCDVSNYRIFLSYHFYINYNFLTLDKEICGKTPSEENLNIIGNELRLSIRSTQKKVCLWVLMLIVFKHDFRVC